MGCYRSTCGLPCALPRVLLVRSPTRDEPCILRRHEGAYPAFLEAILRAEVAFLAQLQAVWALQSPGILLAVLANTLSHTRPHLCLYEVVEMSDVEIPAVNKRLCSSGASL